MTGSIERSEARDACAPHKYQDQTRPAERTPAGVGDGRYRTDWLIGRGGSSEVFRGHDTLLGRAVAIKLFANGSADSGEPRRWREVRTLAGLNHPRLVSVYDVGNHRGRTFFVLQLVEGTNLGERLSVGPLTLSRTLRLGSGLAAGLAYIHHRGVIHRDLKPANILLDRTGKPHLSDFGIATWLGAASLTAPGVVLGTPSFLAPEQVRGERVGPSADVYALGLILLECLTGRREYPGDPVTAAAARLERPPHIPLGLPDRVTEALRAMTHSHAAQRPDAAGLARCLAELQPSIIGEQIQPLRDSWADVRPAARQPVVPPCTGDTTRRHGPSTASASPRRSPVLPPRPRRRSIAAAAAGLAMLLAVGGGVVAIRAAHTAADPTAKVAAAARPDPNPLPALSPGEQHTDGGGAENLSNTPASQPTGPEQRQWDGVPDHDRSTVVEPVMSTGSHSEVLRRARQTTPSMSTSPAASVSTPAAKRPTKRWVTTSPRNKSLIDPISPPRGGSVTRPGRPLSPTTSTGARTRHMPLNSTGITDGGSSPFSIPSNRNLTIFTNLRYQARSSGPAHESGKG
jgi:serine/threonine protein kinase